MMPQVMHAVKGLMPSGAIGFLAILPDQSSALEAQIAIMQEANQVMAACSNAAERLPIEKVKSSLSVVPVSVTELTT